ncbi:MAG: PIN domain-containing protein [Gemmataceae bacterium]|nr:PIN domain-containing protein [Gemmataceae bacterium]
MNAVDTNVLRYAHDPRDPAKQHRAVALLQSLSDAALLWQVACEYLAASAKLEPFGYSRTEAWQDIRDLRSVWTCLLPTWDVLDRAEQLLAAYSLSFWDAMILAACLEAGVSRLYSEDLATYPRVNGLECINPF